MKTPRYLYFAHPESRYFAVGKVTRDQVEDYAGRQGLAVEEVERWLTANLAYDPRPEKVAAISGGPRTDFRGQVPPPMQ